MSILNNFLIKKFESSENSCISNHILKEKVEALAILGQDLILLADHQRQTVTTFNNNPNLFVLFESKPHAIKLDKVLEQINPFDRILLTRYIQIINTHFTNNSKQSERNIYFTISHTIDVYKKPEGVNVKIIPYLYDTQYNLLATIIIVRPIQFAGRAVLKKHYANKDKTDVYNLLSKRFISEASTQLKEIECTIIHLSGMGVKEKDIAKQLNLTLPGLKRMKTIIFEKLKVNSISEAIFVAYKRKYINS